MTLDIKDRLYTSSEVAEILGVSLRSVYRYLEEGKLDADIKTATGRHRFSKKNILDFLKPGSSSENSSVEATVKSNEFNKPADTKTFSPTETVDEEFDFDSAKNGREMQDSEGSMDGRVSESLNPILQTMSDATRAAMRAGRRNVTQAIKNSLAYDKEKNPNGQGILEGGEEGFVFPIFTGADAVGIRAAIARDGLAGFGDGGAAEGIAAGNIFEDEAEVIRDLHP